MSEKIELTSQIYFAVEEWEILDIRNWKKVFLTSYDDQEYWTFPRVNEWVKFANKIDKEWVELYLKKFYKNFWISKIEDTDEWNCFKLTFKNPLKVCVSSIWERLIIENVKEVKIELNYEWYWTKNWRQNKIANWIDILCDFKELLS